MQKTITIPDTWAEVSLNKYVNLNPRDIVGTASLLWDVSREDISKMDLSIYDIMEHLDFITKDIIPTLEMEIAGCSIIQLSDLNTGDIEYIETLAKDFKKNIVYIAAWLYRNDMSELKRAEMLGNTMTVDQLFGALSYFSIITGVLIVGDKLDELFNPFVDNNLEEMMTTLSDNPEKVNEKIAKIKKEIDG